MGSKVENFWTQKSFEDKKDVLKMNKKYRKSLVVSEVPPPIATPCFHRGDLAPHPIGGFALMPLMLWDLKLKPTSS